MKVRDCPVCGNPDLLTKHNKGYCYKCDLMFKVKQAGENERQEIIEHYKRTVFK